MNSNRGSFREKVQKANELLNQFYESDENIESLTEFVSDTETARAFFVAWLTEDREFEGPAADSLVKLVDKKIELCAEVLVKNLVMSEAMILQHRDNGKEELAEGSLAVNRRTGMVLKSLEKFEPVKEQIELLQNAIAQKKDPCSDEQESQNIPFYEFLERWQYDINQLNAMEKCLKHFN